MEPILFSNWGGNNGFEQFCINYTGCKPFSGAGICPRVNQKTTILKSVDGTEYYDDDMSDIKNVKYTLFGHNGDQSEFEHRFNEPLLNKSKTQNIYLYRVRKNNKKNEYIWYGKYEIIDKITKQHPGKDGILRTIIILNLQQIEI